MARGIDLRTNLTAGELDPALYGRTDLKNYFNAAKRIRNALVVPQGGAKRRPGTLYKATATDNGAGSPSDTRLIEFEYSTEEHYLFLVQHNEAEIYKDGSLVATITLPYSSDDIRAEYDADGNLVQAGISWTQSYDTLLIFHEDYAPRRILRGGDDATWTVDEWPVKNVPFFDFGNDYSTPITATGSNPNGTGANPENLVDGDDTTDSTVTAPMNFSGLSFDQRRVFQIDLGSVQTIQSCRWLNLNRNSTAQNFGLCYSEDGTTWTQLGEEQSVASTDVDYTVADEVTLRYLAIYGPDGNWTSGTWNCGSLEAFIGRTAVDEVQTLDFQEANWNNADESFSLVLEGEQTEPIDYDSTATTLAASIEAALRDLPNTSKDGITVAVLNASDKQFSVTFSGEDGGRPWEAIDWELEAGGGNETISILRSTRGVRPGEPVWSGDVGYPRCGTFFQGRLIVAGSRERPSTVWASRAGDIWDFNTLRTTADYGIEATADTDQVSSFFAINAGRHLQLFSSDAEFYVPSSDTEGITPQNFALRRSTKRGARAGLPVFDVDGAAMFVQRGGKTLREFIFTDTELAYQANNISLLASHLMRQPVAFSYQQAQSTEDADYLLMVNNDGTLTAYCTLRTQEVNAYTLQETDGLYHDIQVDLQEVYQVVQRTINGSTVRYLEVWDARMRFDCGAADFDVSTPITTITGLSHLEGETVGFVVDGVLQTATDTVTSGSVDLPVEATSSWQLGIPFPDVSEDSSGDEWCIEMLPPEMQLDSGPVFGTKYRIMEVTVRLADTTGLKLNNERKALTGLGDVTTDLGDSAFTGVVRYKGFGGWGFEQTMKLSDDRAGHAEVLAIKMRVQV